MKTQADRWLSRNGAATQLGITPYQLDRLAGQRRIRGIVRPGLTRPQYRESDVLALRQQLERELAAA
jgi:hypothetical protein